MKFSFPHVRTLSLKRARTLSKTTYHFDKIPDTIFFLKSSIPALLLPTGPTLSARNPPKNEVRGLAVKTCPGTQTSRKMEIPARDWLTHTSHRGFPQTFPASVRAWELDRTITQVNNRQNSHRYY